MPEQPGIEEAVEAVAQARWERMRQGTFATWDQATEGQRAEARQAAAHDLKAAEPLELRDKAEQALAEAESQRDQAVERRREIESKLESGYAFCHPESDCEGLKRAFRAMEERDEARQALAEFRERVETEIAGLLREPRTSPAYRSGQRLQGTLDTALQPTGEQEGPRCEMCGGTGFKTSHVGPHPFYNLDLPCPDCQPTGEGGSSDE